MTGESLLGGPERSLCETVQVKPGLCWRPGDIGDARAVGYLPRRESSTKGVEGVKIDKCVVVHKARR